MLTIRTFIAIHLPDEIKNKIAKFQSELKITKSGISWVKTENIHLTLKFLGDVEEKKLNDIFNGVKIASQGIKNFEVHVKNSGVFPNFKRPRVLWVGFEETTGALINLQNKIENEMHKLGFKKEDRNFSPHLTIGRVKSPNGVYNVIEVLSKTVFEAGKFEVNSIAVMKSDLKPSGAEYTKLFEVKLK